MRHAGSSETVEPDSARAEARLAGIIEEYLAGAEAGDAPSPDELMRAHPELAADLKLCLAAVRFIGHGGDDARADPLPHGELGDFRILREIGRGGMGVVYESEQLSLKRHVALKVLPFAAVLDQTQLQRFRNEAQAAASLHHTHIVPVYSVGSERGVHYYAMQYIEGLSVAELVTQLRSGRATESAALEAITKEGGARTGGYVRAVARQGLHAADALEHAHAHGVIHRDIKPGNLLVDSVGHLWITDFGLACSRHNPSLTMTGDLVGTIRYMSPEQALGRPVDHRTDIYSLGATLYEFVTLEGAFRGEDPHQVLQQLERAEPRRPRSINPAVPVELETILLKAMAKERADRYATAREMAEDLQRFLDDRPIRARRPSPVQRATKWARRHRRVVTACIAALVLAVAGLAVSNLLIREQRDLAEARGDRLQTLNARAGEALDNILDDVRMRLPPGSQVGAAMHTVLAETRRFYGPIAVGGGNALTDRFETARAHLGLGRVAALLGEAEATEALHRAVLEFQALVEVDPAYRPFLARARMEYGIQLARTDPAAGEPWFRLSIREWDRALDGNPLHPALRHGRGRALGSLADFLARQRRLEEALRARVEASRIFDQLAKDDGKDPVYLEDGAWSWYQAGHLFMEAEDFKNALQMFIRANNRYRDLRRLDPTNQRYVADWQRAHLGYARAQARLEGRTDLPEPFEPVLDAEVLLPDAQLTMTPAPFQAELFTEINGVLPMDPLPRKILVHRGEGQALYLGKLSAESRSRFLQFDHGLSTMVQWKLVDRHGDALVLNCRGDYSRKDGGWVGEYWIEAGTGRYAGARGNGRALLFFNRGPVKSPGVRLEGTIYRGR